MQSDKNRFHDHSHAREYDRRAAKSDIREQLAPRLVEALDCKGDERVLDLATGTGRFARPVAQHLKGGKIVGLDEALAMLRVAQEQKEREPIPGFLATAGTAEAFPFHSGLFDRAFTVFALHHFGHPPLTIREALRILKPGGRFVILDPVVATAEDSLDESIHDLINQILRSAHGDYFHYHSAEDIQDLLTRAGFRVIRADLHAFSVDQDGMEGVPTGRHWLEIAEQLQEESSELKRRFEEKYFRYEKRGERVHIQGSFGFALVCGEK
ncbi:MAG: methyltransferase domain-containing protein [Deltaproteobacteria bacterium]|nr:methyltransferase domain-containing protein [Deltaproteobacteria bacterium]